MGKQVCEDTGPLTRKRMETADQEFVDPTKDFIKRNEEADNPWFAWLNTFRLHLWTNLSEDN